MHVFITGATGTIGTPVVSELLHHGHSVLGLARSERSADALSAAGAEVLRGEIGDLDRLTEGAAGADAVITLAFTPNYDSADGLAAAIAEERTAALALGESLVGSDRALITVSGTPWIPGRLSTEADPLPLEGPVAGRAATVQTLFALAARGVRVASVRMPRTVHQNGRGGFAGLLTDQARRSGVAGYPGDGTQRWPAVHALDAAVIFRRVLESAPPASTWHAVADEGDAVRDIAAVISRRLGLESRTLPVEDFGPFGPIFAMDQPASSAITRRALEWEPAQPRLLADLELIER